MTDNGTYPQVEFLSAETMVNVLAGCGVACESTDAGLLVGVLLPWNVKPQDGVFVVGIFDTIYKDHLVGATDIRNFTKITVL